MWRAQHSSRHTAEFHRGRWKMAPNLLGARGGRAGRLGGQPGLEVALTQAPTRNV